MIKIERVNIEDAEELLSIYAPYVRDTAISFEYEVPSAEEFRERIWRISSCFPYIKAVEGDRILGYAYADKFKDRKAYDWSVEVTVYVRKDARKTGIGSLLYGALEDSLRRMGVLNMNACIAISKEEDEHLSNDSYHFHKKMGYRFVGTFHNSGYKFDTWYDMIWMEKMIGEHKNCQEGVKYGEWTIAGQEKNSSSAVS
ncbi:N-acetyltransferase family protein [Bariatricus sp. SGI.154]|uniref:GNAT family N-acetyltransferase n=1 Tax=Bariatricus sp. SGI.154 TaxID=3420549 RepID=UPI003D09556F